MLWHFFLRANLIDRHWWIKLNIILLSLWLLLLWLITIHTDNCIQNIFIEKSKLITYFVIAQHYYIILFYFWLNSLNLDQKVIINNHTTLKGIIMEICDYYIFAMHDIFLMIFITSLFNSGKNLHFNMFCNACIILWNE